MELLRISAKNLGALAMPDCCHRCFWLKAKMGFKLPHQIFPGIFSSIDSLSKLVTHRHFAKHGALPLWFKEWGDLGQPIKTPHFSSFQLLDREQNILLTGTPDDVFRRSDGALFIVDYKTARHTSGQDVLLPIYKTQLAIYARIAEALGMGKVWGLGLLYYEPPEGLQESELDSVLKDDGFLMRFKAKVLPIANEQYLIPTLIKKAREIFDMLEPPPSREGCKECGLLDKMIGFHSRGVV